MRAHLSTSDRLAEMLCGLITVLTFTLLAHAQVDEGRKGVLELLAASFGCAVTWGLLDGVLYVLDAVSQRARRRRLARRIQNGSVEEGRALVAEEVEELHSQLGAPRDAAWLEQFRASVGARPLPPLRVTREEWLGGVALVATQVLCCLPAVVPFLVLGDPHVALRVSNGLLIAMLLGVGFRWGAEVELPRLACALAAGVLGAVLIGIEMIAGS